MPRDYEMEDVYREQANEWREVERVEREYDRQRKGE